MKMRLWYLAVIVAGTAGGVWLLLPAPPAPPNFVDGGFVSVHVEFRGVGGGAPVSASSSDPAVVAELAEVMRTGRSVVVCRCAVLGSLEFQRPDGTAERVLLMPAHDDRSVEFRVMEQGRYRVDREWFLRAVQPLGVPRARWYSWPVAGPAA